MNGPWYNTTMFSLWHGLSFEGYVTTSIRDRYNLMCSIESHESEQKTINIMIQVVVVVDHCHIIKQNMRYYHLV